MNADPQVMEYFTSPLVREHSDALVDRIEAHFETYGFGQWAVEIPGQAPFVGFIGMNRPSFDAYFTPCVEVGWRLARPFWGLGYATEGARAALDFGFEKIGLDEIVSFAVCGNARSIRVMERIGMRFSAEFDHPGIPAGHPLRRHVLYRVSNNRLKCPE